MSIAAAGLLVALKLGAGLATGSLGLISAGIESSGDVVAAVLTFFAVRLGARPADPEHPYGHRRAENLGALGEAGILFAGGLIVSVEAIRRLLGSGSTLETVWYQFAVLAIALAVDLSRSVVSLRVARRYDSPALRSNGLHFAADMMGSLAVLAGLLAAAAGFAQGDSVAALVVAAMILVTATRLIGENANILMDRTPAHAREAAERAIAELGSRHRARSPAPARVGGALLRRRRRQRPAGARGRRGTSRRGPDRGGRRAGAAGQRRRGARRAAPPGP